MFNKTIITIATLTLTAVSLASFSEAASLRTTKSDGGRTANSRSDKPDNNYFWRRHLKSDSEISCKEGLRIVARQGFEHVRTLKCQGRNFSYVAIFDGDLRRVDVNRRGDIVGAWRF